MSDRATELLLFDILEAIDKILKYTADVDFDEFQQNQMMRDAIERNIEIIGEAANKIPMGFRNQHSNIEWHKPIAMRNRLIHGYFAIDIPMLWNTITTILPSFRNSIHELTINFDEY